MSTNRNLKAYFFVIFIFMTLLTVLILGIWLSGKALAAGIDGNTGLPTYAQRQQAYVEWISDNYRTGVSTMGAQYIAWWLLGDKQRVISWLGNEQNIADYIILPFGTPDDNNLVHRNWRRSALQRLYYISKDDMAMTPTALANLKKYAAPNYSDDSAPTLFEYMNPKDWHNRKWASVAEKYFAYQINNDASPPNLSITICNAIKLALVNGFTEYNSPTYIERYIYVFYDFYDFSMDPKVREASCILLDWWHLREAHKQIYSVPTGPWDREYNRYYWKIGIHKHTKALMEFLTFGNNTASMSYFYGWLSPIRVASSSYRPPKVVDTLAWDRVGKGEYEYTEYGYYHYFFATPYFIVSHGYEGQKGWEVLFGTGYGTDYMTTGYGEYAPTTDGIKNVMVVRNMTKIPSGLTNDETIGPWRLIQKGNVYVAYALRSGSSYVVEVSDTNHHPTFADFRADFVGKDSTARPYVSCWGVTLAKPPADPLMESPWVQADNNGLIQAQYSGFSLTLDMSNPDNPVRYEGTSIPPLSGDVNDDKVVDILDLQLCVNVFLGTETRPDFIQRAKEVALPYDECNVLDVQGIVNIILTP